MNNNIKDIYRKKYRQLRSKALLKVETKIIQQVKNSLDKRLRLGKLNGFVGLYWPLAGEVDLRGLKQKSQLPLALPVSNNNGTMNYHPWTNKSLIKDYCGIPSPSNNPPLKPKEISLILVPALAVDEYGYRLGYGGGFFDRLRSDNSWRSIYSLIILPEICVLNKPLPHEVWDIPFNGWINENGEHDTKRS